MDQPLWQPSRERVARANLSAFARQVAEAHGERLRDYAELRRWSVDHPELFWPALWRFADLRASRPWDRVLEDGARMPGARWFTGAKLNFAENLLRCRDDRPAIIAWTEDGRRRALSYRELHEEVAKLAAALAREGVGPGDRVAAVMPHAPETVIAMLATTALGAIWSSCSPDFGIQGVLDRFGQIEPKVLITIDGYRYNGKPLDVRAKLAEIVGRLPGLKRVVMVPFLDEAAQAGPLAGAVLYHEFVVEDPPPIAFAQLPFDHPICILYSSGTTGVPKAIVHGAGGTLLQHLKELMLHTDLKQIGRAHV